MATFSVQTEPVKGFLTRYLRRKWLETEVKYGKTNIADPQLNRIIDWIPRVSIYLNRFLENFFPSQNVSIGMLLYPFLNAKFELNLNYMLFQVLASLPPVQLTSTDHKYGSLICGTFQSCHS